MLDVAEASEKMEEEGGGQVMMLKMMVGVKLLCYELVKIWRTL